MALGRTFDSKIPVCHFPLKLTWSQQWKLREWGHDKSKNFTKGKDSNVEEKKNCNKLFFYFVIAKQERAQQNSKVGVEFLQHKRDRTARTHCSEQEGNESLRLALGAGVPWEGICALQDLNRRRCARATVRP